MTTFRDVDRATIGTDLGRLLGVYMQQSDPDTLVTLYNRSIISVLDKQSPAYTITPKGNNLKLWHDDEVHEAKKGQITKTVLKLQIRDSQTATQGTVDKCSVLDRSKSQFLPTQVC